MELRPGYQCTELGIVPLDWAVEPLGNRATFRTGPFGSALHQADYISDGIPVINPMHIVDGELHPTTTMTISEQAAKRLSDFCLSVGEVVIGRRGDMGRCAVVRQSHSGWLCGTGSMIIRPQKVDAEFLQLVLSSPPAIKAIEDASVGTTMINLNQGTLASLKLQFPPIEEQRAIATALSDVDALIAGLEKLIAKKRDLKQAAMQQLLTGQTRLPGFSGEWSEMAFGSWGKCHRGVSYNPDADLSAVETEKTIRLLRSNNVQDASIALSDVQYVNANRASNEQRLRKNDVLICMANGSRDLVGKAARFEVDDGFDYTFGAFMGAFRPDEAKVDVVFAFYCFQSEAFRRHVSLLLAGSSINNLKPASVESCEVLAPKDLLEQSAIATCLADMDKELNALTDRLIKTRALKQGMMQELLTGKTRLV